MDITSNAMHLYSSFSRKDHIEYTWSIKDFSTLPRNRNSPSKRPFFIHSDPFSPLGNDQLKFAISLEPYGKCEENKDGIALYLILTKWQGKDVPIKFTLSILKANGEVFRSITDNCTFTKLMARGWPEFISRETLLNKANEVLCGDVLKICCAIEIVTEQRLESEQDPSRLLPQQFSIKCFSQQAEDWSSLLTTGQSSDVTLVVSGKRFKVHKMVLSTRSPVFKRMLEKSGSIVFIMNVNVDMFKTFLQFLYSGKVTIGENAFELMVFADKYAVESLKTLCVDYLASKLTNGTVVSILMKADQYSAKELKDKAIQFLIHNLASIEKAEKWEAIIEARPKLYLEVVRQIKASKPPN